MDGPTFRIVCIFLKKRKKRNKKKKDIETSENKSRARNQKPCEEFDKNQQPKNGMEEHTQKNWKIKLSKKKCEKNLNGKEKKGE